MRVHPVLDLGLVPFRMQASVTVVVNRVLVTVSMRVIFRVTCIVGGFEAADEGFAVGLLRRVIGMVRNNIGLRAGVGS